MSTDAPPTPIAAPAPRTVSCPACGKPVIWQPENRYRPFCSARCKTMDFGAWAAETYRIGSETPPELPESGTPPV